MSFKISVITPAFNAENYLVETLDSLVNQTFQDFEVIIVNDGSTDQTQKIIDKYCKKYLNFKSITQPNLGVSKARNRGLKEASGDYIAFLDADDLFTPKALEKMYKAAFENDAELVIGGMKEFDNFESKSYVHPKILSKMGNIDKFEYNILWTFSQSNKLFLKKKINKLGLHFEDVKYSEDGVFVMNYIYSCDKITGCNYEVLLYRKRNFWETSSTTQSIRTDSINNYLLAHEMMYTAAEKSLIENLNKAKTKGEIAEAKVLYYDYLDSFLYKEVYILLNQFYRRFWLIDDDSIKFIKDSVFSFKDRLCPKTWEKLKNSFKDLKVNELITSKREMVSNPIITIALNPENIGLNEMETLISSIYAQDFPAFELLVNHNLKDIISDKWKKNPNFKFLESNDKKSFKNNSLIKAKGNYILFIENPIILDPRTLKNMFSTFSDCKNCDMVASKIKKLSHDGISEYISQELAYSYRNTVHFSRRSKFNYLDFYLTNKLIKIDFLRKIKFKFSSDSTSDVKKLYEKAKFKKISENFIFSNKNEKELINSLKCPNKFIFIKLNLLNLLKKPVYTVLKSRRFIKHNLLHNVKGKLKSKTFNIFIKLFRRLPLRNRVFFYSIRSNDNLLENNSYVYEELEVNKHFISKMLPHSSKIQLKMLYYLLTSKVIVTDDYLRYLRQVELRKEQKVIQLWHACGAFKKFGLDHPSTDIKTEIKTHQQYDDVMVSSEYVRKYYSSAFGLPINKIKALGVPRTDMFFDEENKKTMLNNLYQQFPQLKEKKTIVYCPTFRENNSGHIKRLDTKIDWEKLNVSLDDNELFIINKHPLMKEDLLNGQMYDKIIDLSHASTYALMLASDAMITDYSSVIFEYSLLDKPIAFYCPDKYTRDFYLKYPEDLPGVMICNSDDLIKEVRSLLTNPSVSNLKSFKMKFMNSCDGNSTKRVAKLIVSYLSKNKESTYNLNNLNPVKKDNGALNLDSVNNMPLKNVEVDKLSEEQNIKNLK